MNDARAVGEGRHVSEPPPPHGSQSTFPISRGDTTAELSALALGLRLVRRVAMPAANDIGTLAQSAAKIYLAKV